MKIGFVIPWFGMDIPGGAEAELRGLILHLKDVEGLEIEILTTCVKQFSSDWNENYHKPGVEKQDGFLIRRFPVRKRDTKAFDQVNAKLMRNELPLTQEEEEIYFRESVNSPELYGYMEKNQNEYDLFVFIPYMFGTTYYGCQICPKKSILIPCLHDESYAYINKFVPVFSNVAGMVFNAKPEKELAKKLFKTDNMKLITMGIGMDMDIKSDKTEFYSKYNIQGPFLLYAGRKEAGKRVDLLIQYFTEYKLRNESDLKLVLIGGGEIEIPEMMDDEIIDLGFVDIQDKYNAYGAATALCQPSEFESFSLVIMESWLCNRPVIVNNKCIVTKNFAIESKGGLYFDDYFEFEGALNYLINNTDVANAMGENGRNFVLNNFSWDAIVKKYMEFFKGVVERNG